MKLQDVILKAMAKKIRWLEAAEIAGVTDRTIRRIRERYREFGYNGLFDQRCGKRSAHRVPIELAEEIERHLERRGEGVPPRNSPNRTS